MADRGLGRAGMMARSARTMTRGFRRRQASQQLDDGSGEDGEDDDGGEKDDDEVPDEPPSIYDDVNEGLDFWDLCKKYDKIDVDAERQEALDYVEDCEVHKPSLRNFELSRSAPLSNGSVVIRYLPAPM